MMQNDQDKARLMRELKTLADGKDLTKELEPTKNRGKWVVREITMIGKLYSISPIIEDTRKILCSSYRAYLRFLI